jgi:hypothetical protein
MRGEEGRRRSGRRKRRIEGGKGKRRKRRKEKEGEQGRKGEKEGGTRKRKIFFWAVSRCVCSLCSAIGAVLATTGSLPLALSFPTTASHFSLHFFVPFLLALLLFVS